MGALGALGALGAMGAIGAMGAMGAARGGAAVILLLLAGGHVHAQTGMELSLDEAVKIAIEREPSLRAARAEVDVARGIRQQAALRPNPSLMMERREEPAGTDNQTMVQVSVPLDLFRRAARVDVAERELEAVDRSVADRARVHISEVKLRYGQAAAAARDLRIAMELAASARRELTLLQRRVDEGASPPIDRDVLDVEVRRLESGRLLAAGRADAATAQFTRAIGVDAETRVTLSDTIETLASPAVPVAAASTPPKRPDIEEADVRVRLADARIEQAESEGRVDVSLFGSYVRMDAGFPQRGFDARGELERVRGVFNYVSGGAMVMVPLWNRNQGAVAAARAERTAAQARLEAVRVAAKAEIAEAAALTTSTRQVLSLMADAVTIARRNLDVIRQTYELGRATLQDVLIEQRRYFEVEHEYTSALRDAFEARISLELARGEQ